MRQQQYFMFSSMKLNT